GAIGLSMAGRGVTLVLHASWFNYSSWIRAKEIAAIRVYGCRALTSPRISGFRPSMKFRVEFLGHSMRVWQPRGIDGVCNGSRASAPSVWCHLECRRGH
ncbi:hypothetical protein BHM03_00046396, partial [Ensete ventricosum]